MRQLLQNLKNFIGFAAFSALCVVMTYLLLKFFTYNFTNWFGLGPLVWLIVAPCVFVCAWGAFGGFVAAIKALFQKAPTPRVYVLERDGPTPHHHIFAQRERRKRWFA